ncbi:sel1 repeat family protein [Streptomyces lasiicapitis]|uniref:zinc ribbon domain-containing protein n=1 Tax=Streptomyces lasiicapitis TaxID=1923961 RepID=UPI0033202D0A
MARFAELDPAERELRPEEATVYCPMCEARLTDDDRFCTDCGHDMSVPVPAAVRTGPPSDGKPPVASPVAASSPVAPPLVAPPPVVPPPGDEASPFVPSPVGPTQPTTRNSVSDGSAGTVIQAGTIAGDVTVHAAALAPAPAKNWTRVSQLRRLWFGVRPTSRFGDEESLTPYVLRDCDEQLHALVTRGVREGGLVVVTGGPLSGKTMTAAWAALNTGVDPEPRVHAPHPGADLRDLTSGPHDRTGHHILWLDELEGHLGPHGLTTALLSRLTQERVLVLATMTDTAYDEHRFGGGAASRVLSGAHTVELSRRWSEAELGRLAGTDDPRLADAREWRGKRGVTECLALAPELWDEWRRARRPQAHPRGHLLVLAAVDLARCGLRQDVPLPVLRVVHELYPQYEADNPYAASPVETESFEGALAWATRPRYEATGLLVPGEEADTYRAYGSLVADAVRSGELGAVPDWLWAIVADGAREHGFDLAPVLTACRAATEARVAAGDVDAYGLLGFVTEHAGNVSEAEGWYRRAADQGDRLSCNRLGHILAGRGAVVEAIGYLEKAAEAGSKDAYVTLGKLHRDRARHWLTKGAEEGDPQAAFHLAELTLRPGRVDRAVRWYHAAAQAGHRDAAFALNVLRVGITATPKPEEPSEPPDPPGLR